MSMGIAFLPGTFPTGIVLDAVREGLPTQTENWSRKKINDLYMLYKDAITKGGQPRFETGKSGSKAYMMENSNYSENDIRVFLFILYTLAQKGQINQKYWDISLQEERGLQKKITDIAESPLNKTLSNVKWVGIVAITGTALYLSWPFLKTLRKQWRKK